MKCSCFSFPVLAFSVMACALATSLGSQTPLANVPIPSADETSAASAALRDYVNWTLDKPNGPGYRYEIDMKIASTDVRHFVGYSTAILKVVRHHREHNVYTLAGVGAQYFSDRTWQAPGDPGEPNLNPPNPFDPKKQDSIGVSIDVSSAIMTLTLKSWGSAQVVVPLVARNGVFYGFSDSDKGGMCIVNLKEIKIPSE